MSEELNQDATTQTDEAPPQDAPPAENETPKPQGLQGLNVPTLFAAHMPPRTVTFHIGDCKDESSFTMRMMTGEHLAQYRDERTKFSTQSMGDDNARYLFEGNSAACDRILLENTVVGGDLYYPKPDGGVQHQMLPLQGPARSDFFKRLHADLRYALVYECKITNGIDPNLPV